MYTLTTWPLWLSALVVIVLPTALAMLAPLVVRRFVTLEQLRTNNEVAGFKFATVGVVYAVLLAFAVIVVWERFHQGENQVAQEAGAAATLYRLSRGLDETAAAALAGATTAYLQAAVRDDWTAMQRGNGSRAVAERLDALYATALRVVPHDGKADPLAQEILLQLDALTQARTGRLVLAGGTVPGVIWLVLFTGGFLTIAFTLFFGTANTRAQTTMTGALAVLILSGLFVIVAIDRPFSGPVSVQPEALQAVLDDFAGGHA